MRNNPFTPGEIIFSLKALNVDNAYDILDPIRDNNRLECEQTINQAVVSLNVSNKPIVIPILNGANWAALVLRRDTYQNNIIAEYADPSGNVLNGAMPNLYYVLAENHRILTLERSVQQIDPNQIQNFPGETGVIAVLNMNALARTRNLNAATLQYNNQAVITQLNDNITVQGAQIQQYNTAYNNYIAADTNLNNNVNEIATVSFHQNRILSKFAYGIPPTSQLTANIDHNRLRALNVIARAYSSTPYTAVIECINNPNANLYISLSSGMNRLNDQIRNNIARALATLSTDRNNIENRNLLFRNMYLAGNSSLRPLIKFVIDHHNGIDQQEFRYFRNLQNQLYLPQKNIDLNSPFFNNFVQATFQRMFNDADLDILRQQENLLEKLTNTNLSTVQQVNDLRGTHVEMEGIAIIKQDYPQQHLFNVGLANALIGNNLHPPAPYACASCTAEIRVLTNNNINPLEINIEATSNDNFPIRSYTPSPNITNNPETLLEYLVIIEQLAVAKQQAAEQTQQLQLFLEGVTGLENARLTLSYNLQLRNLRHLQLQFEHISQQLNQLQNPITPAQLQIHIQRTNQLLEQLNAHIARQQEQTALTQQMQHLRQEIEHTIANQQLPFFNGDNNLKRSEKTSLPSQVGSEFILKAVLEKENPSFQDINGMDNHVSTFLDKHPDTKSKKQITVAELPKGKEGEVTLISEAEHIGDHKDNIASLITQIRAGIIKSNTVIYLERKEKGENLDMQDVVLLAKIIRYNDHPKSAPKVEIPKVIKESLIYQDAMLYNIAKDNDIAIQGAEVKHTKKEGMNQEDYNKAREDVMVTNIEKTAKGGKNVIYIVGKGHVEQINQSLEAKGIKVNIHENNAVRHRTFMQLEQHLQKVQPTGHDATVKPSHVAQLKKHDESHDDGRSH